MNVLVTGAAGYLGSLFVRALAQRLGAGPASPGKIVAMDVREVPAEKRVEGVLYFKRDIRAPDLGEFLQGNEINVVAHLAAIITPPKDGGRRLAYEVDVLGAQNLMAACVEAAVSKIVVTSSGAAYGYHSDNPARLTEDHPLRGNEEYAYSHHKLLVEQALCEYRRSHQELGQAIFRVGTIIGESTKNPITALFEKPFLIGLRGSESPFVFAWDMDVVAILIEAVLSEKTGIYNVAGDGTMTLEEISKLTGQRLVKFPPAVLSGSLAVLSALRLTRYGPEQVNFLRYRPVLDNRKLKEEFGYTPRKTSREAFELYLSARRKFSCRLG